MFMWKQYCFQARSFHVTDKDLCVRARSSYFINKVLRASTLRIAQLSTFIELDVSSSSTDFSHSERLPDNVIRVVGGCEGRARSCPESFTAPVGECSARCH